jgi:hypothetical protein
VLLLIHHSSLSDVRNVSPAKIPNATLDCEVDWSIPIAHEIPSAAGDTSFLVASLVRHASPAKIPNATSDCEVDWSIPRAREMPGAAAADQLGDTPGDDIFLCKEKID